MTTSTTSLPTGVWKLDPAHTSITFSVRHLMAAKVRGAFKQFEGSITVGEGPEDSAVDATIAAASIDTGVTDRDQHLRSADFLDVESYPELSFRSTGVRGERHRFTLLGDLTIRDVTRPVELDVEFHGVVSDPWGQAKAVFSAETKIDREDWGLTWNQALEAGGVLVGKDVSIEIEVQATQS